MAQPTSYNRLYDLTSYATANPSAPYNAAYLDAELNAIETTLDETLDNLALIQRDDGLLKNASVHPDSLNTAVLLLISAEGDLPELVQGTWVTGTDYTTGQIVEKDTEGYLCMVDHTSGVFATDVGNGLWIPFTAAGVVGSAVDFTPSGRISATDVEGAIQELDSESPLLAGSSGQVFSVATATATTHAVPMAQAQRNTLRFAVGTGTGNAILATIASGDTVLTDGMEVSIRAPGANTLTAPTFNLTLGATATGAKTIVKGSNSALVAGDIAGASHAILLRYNSSLDKWALLNPAVSSSIDLNSLSTETVLATNDLVAIVDTSESTASNKILVTDFLKVVNTLTEDGGPHASNDFVLTYSASAGAARKVSPTNVVATALSALAAETTLATDDLILISDTSESGIHNRITVANALKIVNALTADATPDQAADYMLTYDADAAAAKKVLLSKIGAGRHTIWVPAAAMQPRTSEGCAALASSSAGAGQPDLTSLDFDADSDEFAQFSVAMPKSWNEGTVTAEFLWAHAATATNFAVVWGLQGVACGNDDAAGAAFGTAQSATDTGGTTGDVYISPETSAITIAGTPAEGDLVFFQVYRDADNGSDTLAIDAKLLGVRLFISTDANTDA